jgi:uncharacterized protein (TIGR03067 family)
MSHRAWPALAIMLWATVSPVGADKSDKDLMQGSWKTQKLIVSGKAVESTILKSFTAVIRDDVITFWNGTKKGEEVRFRLEGGKDPRAVDIVPLKGPRKDKVHAGICAIEGMTLKLCWSAPGKNRPTTFDSKKGSEIFLIVLERTGP